MLWLFLQFGLQLGRIQLERAPSLRQRLIPILNLIVNYEIQSNNMTLEYPEGWTQDLINSLKLQTGLKPLPLCSLTLMEIHIVLPAILALIRVGEAGVVGGCGEGEGGDGRVVGVQDVFGRQHCEHCPPSRRRGPSRRGTTLIF